MVTYLNYKNKKYFQTIFANVPTPITPLQLFLSLKYIYIFFFSGAWQKRTNINVYCQEETLQVPIWNPNIPSHATVF